MTQLAQDEAATGTSALTSFLAICFIALCWVLLFRLNEVFFESIGVSKYIAWIFLPAAIRMLSVMVFEWVGVIGLFFGALITSEPLLENNLSTALVLSALSALGPLAAVMICSKWLRLPRSLAGLGSRQICLFSLMGALFNVIPHNLYLYFSDKMSSPFEGLLPMFIGDLAGTAIVIYLSSLVLKFLIPARA